jgi:hypothetical protein
MVHGLAADGRFIAGDDPFEQQHDTLLGHHVEGPLKT